MTGIHLAVLAGVALASVVSGCARSEGPAADVPHVAGTASVEEAGRYLVTIGGCHDCHTPGFPEVGWEVPESEWLTGLPVGWRGPWGTTYGRNLRLTVQRLSEDQWVEMLRTRTALPPMPWASINRMSEPDLRAIYRFIASLGPGGEAMPPSVPPGEEPSTPFIVLAPPQGPGQ